MVALYNPNAPWPYTSNGVASLSLTKLYPYIKLWAQAPLPEQDTPDAPYPK